LVPFRQSSNATLCTKDYMDWWIKRSSGFFSSNLDQLNGNIGLCKLRLKLKRPREIDEPSGHRGDTKLSLGISEGTDETLEAFFLPLEGQIELWRLMP
jgi:hypothetical protein